jgi:hypothetical protein
MEDLVAVELTTAEGPRCYFVTWGRIQDAVDPAPLEAVILDVAGHFALPGTPVSTRVCDSLQEAREAPLFYEALFTFAQNPIPFGPGYQKWRRKMDKRMRRGLEIAAVGPFSAT